MRRTISKRIAARRSALLTPHLYTKICLTADMLISISGGLCSQNDLIQPSLPVPEDKPVQPSWNWRTATSLLSEPISQINHSANSPRVVDVGTESEWSQSLEAL